MWPAYYYPESNDASKLHFSTVLQLWYICSECLLVSCKLSSPARTSPSRPDSLYNIYCAIHIMSSFESSNMPIPVGSNATLLNSSSRRVVLGEGIERLQVQMVATLLSTILLGESTVAIRQPLYLLTHNVKESTRFVLRTLPRY